MNFCLFGAHCFPLEVVCMDYSSVGAGPSWKPAFWALSSEGNFRLSSFWARRMSGSASLRAGCAQECTWTKLGCWARHLGRAIRSILSLQTTSFPSKAYVLPELPWDADVKFIKRGWRTSMFKALAVPGCTVKWWAVILGACAVWNLKQSFPYNLGTVIHCLFKKKFFQLALH